MLLTKKIGIDLNGFTELIPFKSEATISIGYEDISSMENWDISGLLDWSRRRDEIKPLFYSIAGANLSKYANLTANQKVLGAKYFFVPYSLRVTNGTVTEEQDRINGEILADETRLSRMYCIESMRVLLYSYVRKELISLSNTQLFFRDIKSDIECFRESNDPAFKQWIFGLAPYVGVFAGKVYWSQLLQDELINIYNGAY